MTLIRLAMTALLALTPADTQGLVGGLKADEHYSFEWHRNTSLTISGDAPMKFETEDVWDYSVVVRSTKSDTVTSRRAAALMQCPLPPGPGPPSKT